MTIARVLFEDLRGEHFLDLDFVNLPRVGEYLIIEEKAFPTVWKVERVGHKGARDGLFRTCLEVTLVEPNMEGSPPIGEYDRMIAGR